MLHLFEEKYIYLFIICWDIKLPLNKRNELALRQRPDISHWQEQDK